MKSLPKAPQYLSVNSASPQRVKDGILGIHKVIIMRNVDKKNKGN